MNLEIERKFLLHDYSIVKSAFKKSEITQGFLNSDKNRVVRVRTIDGLGFITIKGISDASGLMRKEWEFEIGLRDAQELLEICELYIIKKTRYYIKHDSNVLEIDIFKDKNEGLALAELELKTVAESFNKPSWLGKEVTGDKKYYNAYLSKHPFQNWK